jgi:hypothetical protein
MFTNTNPIIPYTPHPPLPLKGKGGGDVILFNAFVLITANFQIGGFNG